MVVDVDYKSGLVLVGEYLGGKKRFTEWVPVDAIDVTWNIGGYEKISKSTSNLNVDLYLRFKEDTYIPHYSG